MNGFADAVVFLNDPFNWTRPNGILQLLGEHLWISVVAVLAATALALPAFMAGVRIATVSTVALTTVGVIVGHGGLGQLITGGFNANFYRAEIVTGAVGCVLLALVADVLMAGVERLLTPWTRVRT